MKHIFTGLLLIFCSMQSFAQPGTLDPTFADNAVFKLLNFLETEEEYVSHTLVDNQNFIWMAGQIEHNGEDKIVIVRLTPDGNYETSFGIDGKLILDIYNGGWEVVTGLALQGDDLLVAGHANIGSDPKQFVVKIQSDGFFDSDFGVAGVAILPFNTISAGIAVDATNHIYLPGTAADNITVTKLLPDGSLDDTFDGWGIKMFEFPTEDYAAGITLDESGNIYVFGRSGLNFYATANITSIEPDGSLNTNFSDSGRRTYSWPGDFSFLMSSAILSSDESAFYLAGYAVEEGEMHAAVMAADFTSGLVEEFGNDGYFLYNPSAGAEDMIHTIIEGPEGLYIAMTQYSEGEYNSAVGLVTTNGEFAEDFGYNGVCLVNVIELGNDQAGGLSFQSNGALIVGGLAHDDVVGEFGYAARINTSGIFTGIESTSATSFSVFPNPATDYLYVGEGAQDISGKEFRIIDIHGRVILDNTIQSDQPAIPIHFLTPGIYHLVIENMKPVRFIKTR